LAADLTLVEHLDNPEAKEVEIEKDVVTQILAERLK
jgi:hypothetical protein